jgi:hypothetical protein
MVNNLEESQIERTRHYRWRLISSITWRGLTIIQKISSKFQSKGIIYCEIDEHVLTPFFGKNGSKGVRRGSRWKQSTIGQLKERDGWSTRLANGERDSTLIVGQLVKVIGRWSAWRSADEERKGGNPRDTPKGKHGGGGSVYNWRCVKELVLGRFRLLRESFSIFSIFCLWMQVNSVIIG